MNILCTGCAGFLGSHLIDALLATNNIVIGVDDLSGGSRANLEVAKGTYGDRFVFLEGKLGAMEHHHLVTLMDDVDVVYHLAADATEGRSQFTPYRCTQDGLLASSQVFAAACQAKVKRIVFTSSMAVYGKGNPPFNEDDEPSPVDVYGVNKYAAERCLQILAETHGLEWVILRPHSVYGPRQSMQDAYRNVVTIFINQLLQGKPIYIYGDGEQERQFSYIDDIMPMLIGAGTLSEVKNQIFNIGSSEASTINDLAFTILREFGCDPEIVSFYVGDKHHQVIVNAPIYDCNSYRVLADTPLAEYISERPCEVKVALCDNRKWGKVTGFKQVSTLLEEGIKQTVARCRRQGPTDVKYTDMEIDSNLMPKTWKKKLL